MLIVESTIILRWDSFGWVQAWASSSNSGLTTHYIDQYCTVIYITEPWQYGSSILGFGIGAIYYDWYRRFCLEGALQQEELLDSKNEAIRRMRSAAYS